MKCYYLDVSVLEDASLFRRACDEQRWPERIRAAERLRRDSDRRLSLGAGLLASLFLPPLCAGMKERTGDGRDGFLRVGHSTHGKPFLEDHPDIHFNLSHSGHYAVLSVGSTPNGVDVECRHDQFDGIASRFFTEQEYSLIKRSDDPGSLFVRIWTRKESYLKMTGEGLSADMRLIPVFPEAPQGSVFYEHLLPGHRICVCCSPEEPFEGFIPAAWP